MGVSMHLNTYKVYYNHIPGKTDTVDVDKPSILIKVTVSIDPDKAFLLLMIACRPLSKSYDCSLSSASQEVE